MTSACLASVGLCPFPQQHALGRTSLYRSSHHAPLPKQWAAASQNAGHCENLGKRNTQEAVDCTPSGKFPGRKGHLANFLEKEGRCNSTWLGHFRSKAPLLSAPLGLEEPSASSMALEDREDTAGATVGLTTEDDFQRQVDCFLRGKKKKKKPISATI